MTPKNFRSRSQRDARRATKILLLAALVLSSLGPGAALAVTPVRSDYHAVTNTYAKTASTDVQYLYGYGDLYTGENDLFIETGSYTSAVALKFTGYSMAASEYVKYMKLEYTTHDSYGDVGVNDQRIDVRVIIGSDIFTLNAANLATYDKDLYEGRYFDGTNFDGTPATGATHSRSILFSSAYAADNVQFGYGFSGDVVIILTPRQATDILGMRSSEGGSAPTLTLYGADGTPVGGGTQFIKELGGYEIWRTPAAEGQKDWDMVIPGNYDYALEFWEFNTTLAANATGQDYIISYNNTQFFTQWENSVDVGYLYNSTHLYFVGLAGVNPTDNTVIIRATRPNASAPFDTFTEMATVSGSKYDDYAIVNDKHYTDVIHIAYSSTLDMRYRNYTITTNQIGASTNVHAGQAGYSSQGVMITQDDDGGLHYMVSHPDSGNSRIEPRYAYRANGSTSWSTKDLTPGVYGNGGYIWLDNERDLVFVAYGLGSGIAQYKNATIGTTTFSAAAPLSDDNSEMEQTKPQRDGNITRLWYKKTAGTYDDIAYSEYNHTDGTINTDVSDAWLNSLTYHHWSPWWFEYGSYTVYGGIGYSQNKPIYVTDSSIYSPTCWYLGTTTAYQVGDDVFGANQGRTMNYILQNPDYFELDVEEAYTVYDSDGNLVITVTSLAAAEAAVIVAKQAAFDAYWTEETYLAYFGLAGLLAAFVLPAFILQRLKDGDIPTAFGLLIVEACCIALMVGWLG